MTRWLQGLLLVLLVAGGHGIEAANKIEQGTASIGSVSGLPAKPMHASSHIEVLRNALNEMGLVQLLQEHTTPAERKEMLQADPVLAQLAHDFVNTFTSNQFDSVQTQSKMGADFDRKLQVSEFADVGVKFDLATELPKALAQPPLPFSIGPSPLLSIQPKLPPAAIKVRDSLKEVDIDGLMVLATVLGFMLMSKGMYDKVYCDELADKAFVESLKKPALDKLDQETRGEAPKVATPGQKHKHKHKHDAKALLQSQGGSESEVGKQQKPQFSIQQSQNGTTNTQANGTTPSGNQVESTTPGGNLDESVTGAIDKSDKTDAANEDGKSKVDEEETSELEVEERPIEFDNQPAPRTGKLDKLKEMLGGVMQRIKAFANEKLSPQHVTEVVSQMRHQVQQAPERYCANPGVRESPGWKAMDVALNLVGVGGQERLK